MRTEVKGSVEVEQEGQLDQNEGSNAALNRSLDLGQDEGEVDHAECVEEPQGNDDTGTEGQGADLDEGREAVEEEDEKKAEGDEDGDEKAKLGGHEERGLEGLVVGPARNWHVDDAEGRLEGSAEGTGDNVVANGDLKGGETARDVLNGGNVEDRVEGVLRGNIGSDGKADLEEEEEGRE